MATLPRYLQKMIGDRGGPHPAMPMNNDTSHNLSPEESRRAKMDQWKANMEADTAARQRTSMETQAALDLVRSRSPLPGVNYTNTIDAPMTRAQQEDFYAGLAPPAPTSVPQFKDGGLIGPNGQPVPMGPSGQSGLMPPGGSAPQPSVSMQQIEQQVQQIMQQQPQVVQQIQQAITEGLQSGELTQQELNMAVQLAKAAALNPAMYPKIRQFAIAQGLATEADLPQTTDNGMILVLLAASRAAQTQSQGQPQGQAQPAGGVPQSAMQTPVATMKDGGALPERSHNMDGSIPIAAHEGEYVIPAHVVKAKGTDFFDKMIGKGNA